MVSVSISWTTMYDRVLHVKLFDTGMDDDDDYDDDGGGDDDDDAAGLNRNVINLRRIWIEY